MVEAATLKDSTPAYVPVSGENSASALKQRTDNLAFMSADPPENLVDRLMTCMLEARSSMVFLQVSFLKGHIDRAVDVPPDTAACQRQARV